MIGRPDKNLEPPLAEFSLKVGLLLTLLALLLIYLRAPILFDSPRLWAEEGTKFLSAANAGASFFDNLLFLETKSGGYYNFPAVLAAALATSFSLELAPYFFSGISLVYLLFPVVIVLTGPNFFTPSKKHKLVACLIFLIAPSAAPEAWLNAINAQVYAGLCGACILGEDISKASTKRMLFLCGVLFTCTLSGIYCTFLLPAFTLRLLTIRQRRNVFLWLANALPAVLQSGIFLYLKSQAALSPKKIAVIPWYESVGHTFYHQFLLTLGPKHLVNPLWFDTKLSKLVEGKIGGETASIYAGICIFSILMFLYLIIDTSLKSPRLHLAVALITVSVCTTFAAVGGVAGGRYAALPGAALLLLILSGIRWESAGHIERIRSVILISLLSVSLGTGAYLYVFPRDSYTFCQHGDCPKWSAELAKFREDPSYKPRVWPINPERPDWQWRVKLTK